MATPWRQAADIFKCDLLRRRTRGHQRWLDALVERTHGGMFSSKAPSTPATISKQHCRMLQVERFFRQCRMLLRHCCRFFGNNVAGFGNNVVGFGKNVERNFVLSTKSKQIEHVQFVSTLSKGRNFAIESFDIVAVCGNKVECCFDKVECCLLLRHCCWCGRGLTLTQTEVVIG